MERKLFTHMVGDDANAINNTLTHAGFRRSQTIAYRPACDKCSACKSVRVRADDFAPNKSFRRILSRNADLTAETIGADTTREQFDLLANYLDARHAGGGMSHMSSVDYISMVEETSVDTFLTEYRDADGTLKACLLGDRMQDGLSLVYSFFDPNETRRSLGSYIILDQINQARARGLPFVYLGYFISDSQKMAYKQKFRPLEALGADGWELLD